VPEIPECQENMVQTGVGSLCDICRDRQRLEACKNPGDLSVMCTYLRFKNKRNTNCVRFSQNLASLIMAIIFSIRSLAFSSRPA
jgi:hypothetical protein